MHGNGSAVPTVNGRTRGITAAIEGGFAVLWFGWGQAAAPAWLVRPLGLGAVASALVILAGIVLAVHGHGQPTPMADPAVRRRYNLIVGSEFAVLGGGAMLLAVAGLAAWITVWVCAVVGGHFLPLARIVGDGLLVPLGALVITIAAAALVVGRTTSVAPSTVTGPATGVCLLVAGILTLRGGAGWGAAKRSTIS